MQDIGDCRRSQHDDLAGDGLRRFPAERIALNPVPQSPVAAEAQRRVFDGRVGAGPIDAPRELRANRLYLNRICAFFELAPLLGNGTHALLIAAFAKREDRGRSRAGAADGAGLRARVWRRVHGACASRTAHSDTDTDAYSHANPDTIAISQSDAECRQFRSVGRLRRDQSRQQFPGAARQSVDQRL